MTSQTEKDHNTAYAKFKYIRTAARNAVFSQENPETLLHNARTWLGEWHRLSKEYHTASDSYSELDNQKEFMELAFDAHFALSTLLKACVGAYATALHIAPQSERSIHLQFRAHLAEANIPFAEAKMILGIIEDGTTKSRQSLTEILEV
jgi:hypothetical protein